MPFDHSPVEWFNRLDNFFLGWKRSPGRVLVIAASSFLSNRELSVKCFVLHRFLFCGLKNIPKRHTILSYEPACTTI
jgi:hypothetical protein